LAEAQKPRTAGHEETDSDIVSLRDEFTGNEVCHSDVEALSRHERLTPRVGAPKNWFGPLHPTNDADK
jgi:hypothetical protein